MLSSIHVLIISTNFLQSESIARTFYYPITIAKWILPFESIIDTVSWSLYTKASLRQMCCDLNASIRNIQKFTLLTKNSGRFCVWKVTFTTYFIARKLKLASCICEIAFSSFDKQICLNLKICFPYLAPTKVWKIHYFHFLLWNHVNI